MNSPVYQRKFETNCHWAKDFSDSEWANTFWSKLIKNGAERNVLRLRLLAISLGLHLEKSRPGLSPGASPGPGQEVVQHALSERACFF